ncbi:heavy-metal-associated domain-containing protein [Hymenobacter sp. HSC-4F20]|uniref:heavy-metal-associated domain-containing protein n=1 Tax=Hymenobacter sp. HSC-4F20 TaxID=2864135 RepID=UPI001C731CC7|nr:heavy-metal-associated domain-containing protein [Hymenobacter sp. HSC-4F20]MBX0291179.1 heavy-metal-associated domain-containing protein [Hymenobacter sp. HSC-4F20]
MTRRRWLYFGFLVVVVLGWASWEDPSLHNYARPVRFLQVQVEGLAVPAEAATVQRQLAAVPGVAACVINSRTQVATVLFHEEDIAEADIERVLSVGGTFRITRPQLAPAASTGRQCPVPASYLETLDRIRFALNLRRLFISV